MTTCSKGLLNGPCGGMHDGKCEIDPERDCAWVKIYDRLEELGQLETFEEIFALKDYSKGIKPKALILERGKKVL